MISARAFTAATATARCGSPTRQLVNSSADMVYGDDGNPNAVTLEWRRTNMDYHDTLEDDCHFYATGLDLLKEFNDGKGT